MEQSATDAVGVLQDFIEETVSLKDRLRWRNQSVVPAPKDETVEVCCYVQDEYGVALKRGFITGAEAARIDGEVYWRPELPVPPISDEQPFEPRIEEPEKPHTQVVMHGWCDASERGGMMGLGLKLVKDGYTVFKGFGMRDAAQAGSTYCELQGIVLLVRIAKSMGCTHLYLYNDNQPAIKLIEKLQENGVCCPSIRPLLEKLIEAAEGLVLVPKYVPRDKNQEADSLSKTVWKNPAIQTLQYVDPEDENRKPEKDTPLSSVIRKDYTISLPQQIIHGMRARPGDKLRFRFTGPANNKVVFTLSPKPPQ